MYLRFTVSDNDFGRELELAGRRLYNTAKTIGQERPLVSQTPAGIVMSLHTMGYLKEVLYNYIMSEYIARKAEDELHMSFHYSRLDNLDEEMIERRKDCLNNAFTEHTRSYFMNNLDYKITQDLDTEWQNGEVTYLCLESGNVETF